MPHLILHIRRYSRDAVDVIRARRLLLLPGCSRRHLHSVVTLRRLCLSHLLSALQFLHSLLLLLLVKHASSPCILLSLMIPSLMVLCGFPLLLKPLVFSML